ncbi:hypothetical protein [Desulfitobacterium sp.]|nr:hypothetical protein [Desulfitobacterium sp.]MEA4900491.1 hypothetical protein [Desulfitobacterium sp.]
MTALELQAAIHQITECSRNLAKLDAVGTLWERLLGYFVLVEKC